MKPWMLLELDAQEPTSFRMLSQAGHYHYGGSHGCYQKLSEAPRQ